MNSRYQEIEPQLSELKGLIKLYYTHESDEQDGFEKTTYFPNYTTTINVYQHSKVEWDQYTRTHKSDKESPLLKLLVGKIDRSRETVLIGPFKKITIVFHPLGLNHFMKEPLSTIIEDHFSFFDAFGDSFDDIMMRVFKEKSMELKRELLDTFFAERLIGFNEPRLLYAINEMIMKGGAVSIQSISNELNVTRKTLLRLFKKHLSISPTDWKSILKFRIALNTYDKSINFSSLAYAANFYDQSDLNLHFKQKTGLTPKDLFKVVETVEKELHWKIDNVPNPQDNEKLC